MDSCAVPGIMMGQCVEGSPLLDGAGNPAEFVLETPQQAGASRKDWRGCKIAAKERAINRMNIAVLLAGGPRMIRRRDLLVEASWGVYLRGYPDKIPPKKCR